MTERGCNTVIVSRKDIDVSNRIDPEFFDGQFTKLEDELASVPHFSLKNLIKFRAIKGDSSRRANPSNNPEKSFFYIDIANTNKKDGSIYPQELKGKEASPRARKIVKTNDIILSTVRPNKNAVAIIYPEYNNYICSTGFALFETKDIDPRLLFVYLKTNYSIIQLIRRTRATMYPAVNPNVDIPEILVPKCILKVEKELVSLVDDSIKHLQNWAKKLAEIDKKVYNKFKIKEIYLPESYEKSTIINRKKFMDYANRCDSEFFDPFFDVIDKSLSSHRKLVPLSFLADKIFTGKTPATKEYTGDENDPAIIKVGSLSNKGINWDDVEFIPVSFFESNKKSIPKEDDILLTSSAHSREHIAKKIDVVNDIPKEYNNRCITVGELMTIRLKEKIDVSPYYITSFLRTILGRAQIQRCIRGITAHIYPDDLLKFVKIPLTDDEFMDEISTLVKESEEERTKGRNNFFQAKRVLIDKIESTLKKKS